MFVFVTADGILSNGKIETQTMNPVATLPTGGSGSSNNSNTNNTGSNNSASSLSCGAIGGIVTAAIAVGIRKIGNRLNKRKKCGKAGKSGEKHMNHVIRKLGSFLKSMITQIFMPFYANQAQTKAQKQNTVLLMTPCYLWYETGQSVGDEMEVPKPVVLIKKLSVLWAKPRVLKYLPRAF
jgi:hypothetical protein